jgi:TonB-dependent starch-binding outer membrane protein SusC
VFVAAAAPFVCASSGPEAPFDAAAFSEAARLARSEKPMADTRWNRRRRGPWFALSALLAFLVLPGAAESQDTGTIQGSVSDRSTLRPLAGAQVQVVGTTRGGLTNREGQFTITNVPAGPQEVRVTFIGYRTETQEVQVVAGQTVEVDMPLASSAVALDEVVVTGTAGAVERRRVGASISTVDVGALTENVSIQDFGNALQARVPGVRSIGTVGGVGSGRELKVRGTSSFQLGQRPIVYIDGVRMDTNQTEWGWMADATCCEFSGGAGEDRLGDINPADIDRIEVLKGAAATTLYGSEASNGVIQIFTRRGQSGTTAQWSLGASTGVNRHRANFPTTLFPLFTGPDGTRALDANKTMIENGLIQDYDLTVRGGAENVTYFISAGYLDEEGSVKPNNQRRGNLRMNLRFLPSDSWSMEVNSAYARNRVLSLQSGNNWTALLGNATIGNPRVATAEMPYGEPWVAVDDIRRIEAYSDVSRWTGGVTAIYNPGPRLTQRFTLGLDALADEKERLLPFGSFYVYAGDTGEKNVGYRNFRSFTADYLGQYSFDLTPSVGSELAWGAQGFWETERLSMSTGREYAGPGVTVVGGGAITFGDESFKEVINLGFFAQNRFSYDDRLFFTLGLRVDGNSAFGVNYGLQPYPKADVAWDLTRSPRLPNAISSLRLRSAVGMSGLAPGAFDQFRTFSAIAALDDQPAVTPDNPGNPELKPEATTEVEAGFEMGLFDDRLGIDFSLFRATTRDALLQVALPPSAGFASSQLQNAGEILNQGFEVSFNSTLYQSPRLRWHSTFNVDYAENEVLDLGETAQDGVLGGFREGYPVRILFASQIIGYNADTNTHIRSDTAMYVGNLEPDWNFGLSNTLEFGNLRIYGLVTAERGAVFANSDRPYRIRFQTGDEYLRTLDSNLEPTPQSDSLRNYFTLVSAEDSRDHVRIREVSVSYQVPDRWVSPVGMGRTTVTFSGQNLHWWDDCNCWDPSMRYRGGDSTQNFHLSSGFLAMPQPRRFVLSVRTNF